MYSWADPATEENGGRHLRLFNIIYITHINLLYLSIHITIRHDSDRFISIQCSAEKKIIAIILKEIRHNNIQLNDWKNHICLTYLKSKKKKKLSTISS